MQGLKPCAFIAFPFRMAIALRIAIAFRMAIAFLMAIAFRMAIARIAFAIVWSLEKSFVSQPIQK